MGDQGIVSLLFDANLSPRLVRLLEDLFPGSSHVFDAGELLTDDLLIWDFAKRNSFTLVSKDADFQRLSARRGAPPKVIWIRFGNCPTSAIETALRERRGEVENFVRDAEAAILVIE
jgi:predicted nuclease of predicted toxin-antitoxin system